MGRLLIRWLLGARPASAPVPFTVHRGEREICAGTAFLGAPVSPLAKLSADEAALCFGVNQGGRLWM